MDSSDRKVLMLKRVTKRLSRTIKAKDDALAAKESTIAKLQARMKMLMDRARGNATLVAVPEGMAASYAYAVEFAANFNYRDGSILDVWKDPEDFKKTAADLIGRPVISWNIIKIGEGMYDAEFRQEWLYQ